MAETEEKKYIIDVESNMDEYTKEVAKANNEVDEFIENNKELLASQDKTSTEYIKASNELKVLQKRRTDANRSVQNAIRVEKAATGSYEKLYQGWKNGQVQLKLMENSLIKNTDGTYELSEAYIEQSKSVADAKAALDKFGEKVNDNRLNVGNYKSALSGVTDQLGAVPGATGQAIGGIKALGVQLKALLLNPVVLFVAAIVGALTLLFKAFKKSQENSIVLNKAIGGLKGLFEGLLNILKPVAEFIVNVLVKAFETLGKIANKVIGFVSKGLKFLGFEKAAEAVDNWTEKLKEASKAGSDLAEMEVRLKNALRDVQTERLKDLKTIEELRQVRDDEEASIERRIKANKELGEALTRAGQKQLVIARMQLDFAQKKIDLEGESDENLDRRAEALQRIAEIEEEISGYRSEQLTQAVSLRKEAAEQLKVKKELLNLEIEEYKKLREEDEKARIKADTDERKRIEDLNKWKLEQQLINQENQLQLRELHNEDIFSIQRERLRIQQEAEIRAAEDSGASINIINAKFTAARKLLAEEEGNARLDIYRGFADNLAAIFGKNTAIGKAAAVASATISTYQAANLALATYPPPFSFIAAAAAVVAGLANVKSILTVNSGLPGDDGGGTVPSILVPRPTQRASAQANIFSQPQLSQTQLNAVPNEGSLSAGDIAYAVSKLPAPIVTVEDINAKNKQVVKVESRATI